MEMPDGIFQRWGTLYMIINIEGKKWIFSEVWGWAFTQEWTFGWSPI